MKIGIFTNNYLPITGGLTTSIVGFKHGLETRGHKVYVFAPRYPGYTDSNPDVYRYPSLNLQYKTAYPLAVPFSPRLSKLVAGLKLDIIHSQHPYLMGGLAKRLAKKLKLPLVFTNHTRYEEYAHYIPLLPETFLKWAARTTSTRYANACNAVIAPTEMIKAILIKNGVKAPIEVISSGIDTARFRVAGKPAVRAAIRKKYQIHPQAALLLCVDRIAPEKNIEFLIEAFQKIAAARKETCFMLVGDGPSLAGLKNLAQKLGVGGRMIFTGVIDQKNIPDYYASADIFMHSSLTETQGLVTVEAMASALPVVAVEASGVSDLVQNGNSGILTSYSQPEFVAALLSLLDDKARRLELGRNAEKEAQKYSIGASTEKLLRIYNRVLKLN